MDRDQSSPACDLADSRTGCIGTDDVIEPKRLVAGPRALQRRGVRLARRPLNQRPPDSLHARIVRERGEQIERLPLRPEPRPARMLLGWSRHPDAISPERTEMKFLAPALRKLAPTRSSSLGTSDVGSAAIGGWSKAGGGGAATGRAGFVQDRSEVEGR